MSEQRRRRRRKGEGPGGRGEGQRERADEQQQGRLADPRCVSVSLGCFRQRSTEQSEPVREAALV